MKDTRDPQDIGKTIEVLTDKGMNVCDAADMVDTGQVPVDYWKHAENVRNGKYDAD